MAKQEFKNSHFVWYLEKESRSDTETWLVGRVLNKQRTFLWKKYAGNVQRKLVLDLSLIFINSQKQPMDTTLLKLQSFEKGLSKFEILSVGKI